MKYKASKRTFTVGDIQERMLRNPELAKLNPGINAKMAGKSPETPLALVLTTQTTIDRPKTPTRGKKRREMNQTEREFSMILQRWMKDEDIVSFNYESMTLRWGEGAGLLSYTPDFVAIRNIVLQHPPERGESKPFLQIVFFEVKGAHAWKQDIVKFKAARAAFPLFEFQLHEKGPHGWQKTI